MPWMERRGEKLCYRDCLCKTLLTHHSLPHFRYFRVSFESSANMTFQRAIPIVVGVGDIKNASIKHEDAVEPMVLMLEAIMLAIKDTNLSPPAVADLQSKIDSLDVVATWTWPYPDLPGLLSKKLGITPRHQCYSPHGGNQPINLFDEAARRISFRLNKVAVLTGGEALASCTYLL